MYIHHIKKTTSGGGGNIFRKVSNNSQTVVKPHRRVLGNGITDAIYDTSLGVVKPTRVLQNIRVKKSNVPKKYITFD